MKLRLVGGDCDLYTLAFEDPPSRFGSFLLSVMAPTGPLSSLPSIFSTRLGLVLYILIPLSLLLLSLFARWHSLSSNSRDNKPLPVTSLSIEKLQTASLPGWDHIPLGSSDTITTSPYAVFRPSLPRPSLPSPCVAASAVSTLSESSDLSSYGMREAHLYEPATPISPPLPTGFDWAMTAGSKMPVSPSQWLTWQTVHDFNENINANSNSFSSVRMEPCGRNPSLPPRLQRETVQIFRGAGFGRGQTWRRRILQYG